MELRPWLLWVVAAAIALVLLAADARGQKVFTNTWAVRIAGGPAVADSVARKHGFLNLGQVGVPTACSPKHRTLLVVGPCGQGFGHWEQEVWGLSSWGYLDGRHVLGGRGMGAAASPALGLLA